MTVEQVRASYGARADEYTELLGSVEAHTRTDEGSRPHGAILARRVESVSALASSNLKS